MNPDEKKAIRKNQNTIVDVLSKGPEAYNILLGELSQAEIISDTTRESLEINVRNHEPEVMRSKVRDFLTRLCASMRTHCFGTLCQAMRAEGVEQGDLADLLEKSVVDIHAGQ